MTTAGISVILALDGEMRREDVQAMLPGEAGVRVAAVVNGSGPPGGDTPAADLYVVACDHWSESALAKIEDAVREDADRPVLVLSADGTDGFVKRAFEAGADDLVVLPESPDRVLFALRKAVTRGRGGRAAQPTTLGRMICVLGPKGGTGKTLTTVNLAVALANAGRRPIVVDLDLQFGDVGLALGLHADRTAYDLVSSGGALDGDKIEAYLATHESGVRVLLAPTRPDQAAAVNVDFLRDAWGLLRGMTDVLIVDSPPSFSPEVISAIDACTDLCMVGMLDALSLKNTKLGLEAVERMGYDPGEVTLVLNRADSLVGIDSEDVESVIGRQPDCLVPSDRDIPRSVNEGTPIVSAKPRSGAANAFTSLASRYLPEEQRSGENGGRRRSLLRRRRD